MTQLVVSSLVTNAVKYAPGPLMLDPYEDAGNVSRATSTPTSSKVTAPMITSRTLCGHRARG
ncbi:hypothetical protein ABZT06_20410 [Streptomyces sp. NPDC005483]|uniref:hypothetical protein n=1 Tax=Streptomyces sp. NPDC005483 TaxID=3154882 RepID=UPI0033A33C50